MILHSDAAIAVLQAVYMVNVHHLLSQKKVTHHRSLPHGVIIIQWGLADRQSINATYKAAINNSIGCLPREGFPSGLIHSLYNMHCSPA